MDRQAWLDRLRPIALDWLAPGIILGIGVLNVSLSARSVDYPGEPAAHIVFLAVAVAALGLRRREPILLPFAAMAVVTFWSWLMWSADAHGPFEAFLLLVGAAYSIGAHNGGRRFVVGAGAVVATFVGGQVFVLSDGGRAGDLAPVAVWLAVALGIGQLVRYRVERARRAELAVATRAAEDEQRTTRAVAAERARIAQELQDVLAQGLSTIVDRAAALGSVERAAGEGLADLRRLVGALGGSADVGNRRSHPGIGQLDDLLAPVRAAGVELNLAISGDRAPLPASLELTAYRIVQEALDNVLQHASAKQVRVALTYTGHQLEVEVHDDGRARGLSSLAGAGVGEGLIGMRERVRVFGGMLTTGRNAVGGWSVHARLPVDARQWSA